MRKRFVVHGRVQGVNFRATAADAARRLGLTGRVWNRDDGAVECIAEGEAGAIERMGEWLSHGPRLAEVEEVEAANIEGDPEYEDFRIRGVRWPF
ncbi:MAG: acylphosphatase [Chloroflexi bacterium]|nr:acylphosphatase [Chloroflexota bacterium]